jgi:hypothetical protein
MLLEAFLPFYYYIVQLVVSCQQQQQHRKKRIHKFPKFFCSLSLLCLVPLILPTNFTHSSFMFFNRKNYWTENFLKYLRWKKSFFFYIRTSLLGNSIFFRFALSLGVNWMDFSTESYRFLNWFMNHGFFMESFFLNLKLAGFLVGYF